MKNDKHAWLRILESFLGVMILIGGITIIINRQFEEPDIDSEIHDILRSVFDSLRDDDMIRLAVLNEDECSVSRYIEKKIPSYLAFQPRICSTSQSCEFPTQKELEKLRQEGIDTSKMYAVDKPQGNIYADYTIISSSIYQPRGTEISPKILKLFVWEGTASVPSSCPAEAKCGMENEANGDNEVNGGEMCDKVNGAIVFKDGATCESMGWVGGDVLKCTSQCMIDKSGCEKAPVFKCIYLETEYIVGNTVYPYDETAYSGTLNIGECKAGEWKCVEGPQWNKISEPVYPSTEICNNKNDDCDASVDEDIADITEWNNYYAIAGHTCSSDATCGNCKKITSCVSGAMAITKDWSVVAESGGPTAIVCIDGKDNDCDGLPDTDPECISI